MASIYIYVKVDNSGRRPCADQYIHTGWFAMASALRAHSTSLINLITINVIQLQARG